jgi:sarcosine oxidase subunit gamma
LILKEKSKMSDVQSVLGGASFKGAVEVTEAGVKGMITLRGDLGGDALAKAVKSAVGQAVPGKLAINSGDKGAAAWMSPDELLLIVDYDQAEATVAKLAQALAGEHHLAVNVSDARAVFTLSGAGLRDVLAKGTPADVSPVTFKPGVIRRSQLGQVAAAFWMTSETEATVVCFRSVGEYMFNWLCKASETGTLPVAK